MIKHISLCILLTIPVWSWAAQKQVIGWVENVAIINHGIAIDAKIDTGADNSSLDAGDWKAFLKEGEDWIRFTLKNNSGDSVLVEAPLLRFTEIKRKRAEPVTRPVVQLEICLAGKRYEIPVNLSERANFKYRMLVGRTALEGIFLVDSELTYTKTVSCN